MHETVGHTPRARLASRERQVLALLEAGLPVRGIAACLSITESTVRSYVGGIYRKLRCHSQEEAIAVAREQGILTGAIADSSELCRSGRLQAEAREQPARTRPAQGGYRLLAEILAGCVARDPAVPDGPERAGEAWGRYLVDWPPLAPALCSEAALARLLELLEEIGFAFEPPSSAGGRVCLAVERCPFREVARRHDSVVCGVHLGLIRGALAKLGGRLEVEELRPLAAGGACELALRPAER